MSIVSTDRNELKKLLHGDYIEELVNELDSYGNNALMLACIYPEFKYKDCRHASNKQIIVKKLLENGTNPNIRNIYSGFTPLHWAAKNGEIEIVKLLCEHSQLKEL